MNFESKNYSEKFGKYLGFIFSYFLFTTILYYLLLLTGRISASFSYIWMMLITIGVFLVGYGIKKVIK